MILRCGPGHNLFVLFFKNNCQGLTTIEIFYSFGIHAFDLFGKAEHLIVPKADLILPFSLHMF